MCISVFLFSSFMLLLIMMGQGSATSYLDDVVGSVLQTRL